MIHQTEKGWRIDFRDEHGRRHRKYVPSREAAITLHATIKENVAKAKAALRDFHTTTALELHTACALYLQSRPLHEHTRTELRRIFQNLIQQIGQIPVNDVTPYALERWAQARATHLAPSTLRREIVQVRSLFRYLRDVWHMPESPAEQIKAPPVQPSCARTLTHLEELLVLEQLTPRTRAQFLLGADAGLRSGEVRALRSADVDLDQETIHVHPSKPGRPRQIPLTPRLSFWLRTQIPKKDTHTQDPHIFRKGNSPINTHTLLAHSHRAGVSHFRFHDLRHTFATRLAETNAPTHVIRSLLGHAPRTVTDLYLHATHEAKRQAIDALADYNHAHDQQALAHITDWKQELSQPSSTKELTRELP